MFDIALSRRLGFPRQEHFDNFDKTARLPL
jgi:hypothetical protein